MRDPKYITTDQNRIRPRVNDIGGMLWIRPRVNDTGGGVLN